MAPRHIRLTLEYDGTDYCGWQWQPHGRSIQGELERALGEMLEHPVRIHGSGRTDAGVHAAAQVAAFTTERGIPLRAFERGLSSHLPGDIAVLAATEVEACFDPRRSATGKVYRYTIMNRPSRSPLARRFAWEVFQPLDVEAMREGARSLVGTHDFSAFRASDCEAKTAVRAMRRVDLSRAGDRLEIELEATAFLKHMVRNIVGTLVEVGQGRRAAASVAEVLALRDRTRAGPTAPPQGLCLIRVDY